MLRQHGSNPLHIPRAVLAAARKAGLSYPLWYVGGHERDMPRKKTFEDLVRDAEDRKDVD